MSRHGRLLGVALLVSLAPPSMGGCQTLRGSVLDPDRNAIIGATVSFLAGSGAPVARVESDDRGLFKIDRLEPGDYLVRAQRIGYRTSEAGPLAIRAGDSLTVELVLDVEAIALEPLRVVASRRPPWEYTEPPGLWHYWERRTHFERLGLGVFLTEEDLKPLSGSRVADALGDLVPFLRSRSHAHRPSIMLLRGRNDCKPLVYVDGHLISPRIPWEGFDPKPSRPSTGFGALTLIPDSVGRGENPVDEFINLGEIAAVEVYRGAASLPGEFFSGRFDSSCGAVVIWSKRGFQPLAKPSPS